MKTYQAHIPPESENDLVFPVCRMHNLKRYLVFSIFQNIERKHLCILEVPIIFFLCKYDAEIYKSVCHKN